MTPTLLTLLYFYLLLHLLFRWLLLFFFLFFVVLLLLRRRFACPYSVLLLHISISLPFYFVVRFFQYRTPCAGTTSYRSLLLYNIICLWFSAHRVRQRVFTCLFQYYCSFSDVAPTFIRRYIRYCSDVNMWRAQCAIETPSKTKSESQFCALSVSANADVCCPSTHAQYI